MGLLYLIRPQETLPTSPVLNACLQDLSTSSSSPQGANAAMICEICLRVVSEFRSCDCAAGGFPTKPESEDTSTTRVADASGDEMLFCNAPRMWKGRGASHRPTGLTNGIGL
jgi:hypothetical protein